jgi:antitoxin ChpS
VTAGQTQQRAVVDDADASAVAAFLSKLRGTYDVSQVVMFGSRARGNHRPDSDLDLAVVLNGQRGDFIAVTLDIAGLAFDVLLETCVLVQAFRCGAMISSTRNGLPIRT